eukprot:1646271-Amphidinium_carterae.2
MPSRKSNTISKHVRSAIGGERHEGDDLEAIGPSRQRLRIQYLLLAKPSASIVLAVYSGIERYLGKFSKQRDTVGKGPLVSEKCRMDAGPWLLWEPALVCLACRLLQTGCYRGVICCAATAGH